MIIGYVFIWFEAPVKRKIILESFSDIWTIFQLDLWLLLFMQYGLSLFQFYLCLDYNLSMKYVLVFFFCFLRYNIWFLLNNSLIVKSKFVSLYKKNNEEFFIIQEKLFKLNILSVVNYLLIFFFWFYDSLLFYRIS